MKFSWAKKECTTDNRYSEESRASSLGMVPVSRLTLKLLFTRLNVFVVFVVVEE